MFKVTFIEIVIAITILWIVNRALVYLKTKKLDIKHEIKLILVYICLVVIARIVYFPYHLVNGHIGDMIFDKSKILPFNLNLIPFKNLIQSFHAWGRFIFIGNIIMFIPIGIVWPFCFKKLDNIKKTVLAGFLFSILIELSQLLLYERFTDIDDLITNTFGVFIGAALYFLILSKIIEKITQKFNNRKK